MLTLTTQQIALLGAGAALGGLTFGVMGFAYGVVISVFLHHAFAAPDVVFIVVGGALILNLGPLPRFWREIRWVAALPCIAGARSACHWGCGSSAPSTRAPSARWSRRSSSPMAYSPCANRRASLSLRSRARARGGRRRWLARQL